jgi:ligand-binding SRPBCC domain-containing protein
MRSTPQKDRQFATFVKFRVWTSPEERVDNFYVYFDNVKVLTDNFEAVYDGDDLATIHKTRQLWGAAPAAGAQE